MSSRMIAFAVLLGTSTAHSEDTPESAWREALVSEYEFVPTPPEAPKADSSPLRPGVPMPTFDDEADGVLLPEMTITARRTYRDLDAGIAAKTRRLEAGKLTWKGGPLIQKDIGPLRFGVYSVFYIPVLINFSW